MSLLIGTVAGLFALDDPAEPIVGGTRVNHIARQAGSWWGVDGKGRIHRDGSVVAQGPEGLALNCVQPAHDTIWVGAASARLFRLEKERLEEDDFFLEAPGRDAWYTPWGGPPDVRSMAVDRAGALYVNVHVGGILRYDNTGLAPTIDQDSDVHQVIASPQREGLVLAACALGLARTSNGHDFTIVNRGLHARYCRAVALADGVVFVSASTGPRTSRAGVYRIELDAEEFEPCRDGLPEWFEDNVDSHCLAVLDDNVYIGHGDRVWASTDQGHTWSEAAGGFPQITCIA